MAKIIKCKTCSEEIAASAKVCPKCGAKNKKPIYKKWWFWVIIVIIFLAALGGNAPDTSTTSVDAPDKKAVVKDTPAEKEVETIVLSAVDLAAAYEDNEIKANKLYKDKIVEITGKVDSIGEVLGSTYITLVGSDEFAITKAQCTFKDEEQINKIAELSKGDTVTVIGKVDGKSLNVGVNDCKFK